MFSAKSFLLLDQLLKPLYFVVQAFFSRWWFERKEKSEKVVAIKFLGMGSIIRFASLCEENNVDKTKICIITSPAHEEICATCGFTSIYSIRLAPHLFVFDGLKIFDQIKKQSPSYIVDFERCSNCVGIFRVILAWYCKSFSVSFDDGVSRRQQNLSIYDVGKLSIHEIFLTGIEVMPKSIHSSIPYSVNTNPSKILININASDFLLARRYSIEGYEQLIKELHHENTNRRFYLTGSFSEYDYTQQLVKKLSGLPVENCAGQWSINHLIEELSTCALFITGDSGPMHLAVSMGVSTIVLWGPTQPKHFGYEDCRSLTSLTLRLPCSPCLTQPKSQPALACNGRIDCLGQLSPTLVIGSAKRLLRDLPIKRSINFPSNFDSHKIESVGEVSHI
jgi:hypothetical protein